MKYNIKIRYETGDSFHSENTEEVLDYNWTNLDIVKENLERIKEHYKWYEQYSSIRKTKQLKDQPIWNKDGGEGTIYLLLDTRVEFRIHTFWVGYFETLYGANIEIEDESLSFNI